MEKQQIIEKAKDKLAPLETGNVYDFIQNFSLQSVTDHPWVILVFLFVAFYAFVKRSKFILLFLFSAIAIMLLVRFTLTPDVVGGELNVTATLPFVGGGLAIGGALIYLTFIKQD
ncbi:MAG: hypothetical protein FIA91_05380 [Geobacter sp.]|nr:hypothetical protein [Geobacter sp.]